MQQFEPTDIHGYIYVVILDSLPTGHVTRSMHSELLAFNMGKCNSEALYLCNGRR